MACQDIVVGYPCGGLGEPCDCHNWPYFRPNNNATRGQFAQMLALSIGYQESPGPQIYQDVPPGSTFYTYINQLSNRGIVHGYECGSIPAEPCVDPNAWPYFRPNYPATRAQVAQIVALAEQYQDPAGSQLFQDVGPSSPFYYHIQRVALHGLVNGYPCGGQDEPCIPPGNLPYYRRNNGATRGQAAKMLSIAIFPNCNMGLYRQTNPGKVGGLPPATQVTDTSTVPVPTTSPVGTSTAIATTLASPTSQMGTPSAEPSVPPPWPTVPQPIPTGYPPLPVPTAPQPTVRIR